MTKEERRIEDELQLAYIKEWQNKKNTRKHHCSMIKLHLECAFEHLVLLIKGKGARENE